MNNQKSGFYYRKAWVSAALVLLLIACCISLAGADDSATALGVIPGKSDIANLAFANAGTGAYYFKFDQTNPNGGGLNAIHIASSSAAVENYGDVTTTTGQSGTFYITETGGRGYQDEAILLVAVKGNIPSDFSIHITSSGYSWTPTGKKDTPPSLAQIQYNTGAVDQTFTRSDFVYGSQTWKPAGNNAPSDYPLYYGQDTSDTSNTFKLMFVDLRAGPLGASSDIDTSALMDKGAVKVDYTIENLDTVAAFNIYAWNDNTAQGNGISWANRLVGTGSSGYTVLGSGYKDRASEFPTAVGSAPVYHPPDTDFKADVTSGAAPLTVQFTDTTIQSVKTWEWDFDNDGTIDSTERNPQHVYAKEGTYTVALNAANAHGKNATMTKAGLITVTAPAAGKNTTGTSSGGSTGYSSGGGSDDSPGYTDTATGVVYRVNFTANATAGIAPLPIQFSDFSEIPNSTTWAWDFTGDGLAESSLKNPLYTFRKAGNYSVNLTVSTSDKKTFSMTRPQYIHVLDMPSLNSDEGWISSDLPDTGAGSQPAGPQSPVTPAPPGTGSPSAGVPAGSSPLGTKVAEVLFDSTIAIGVIGGGILLWRKM